MLSFALRPTRKIYSIYSGISGRRRKNSSPWMKIWWWETLLKRLIWFSWRINFATDWVRRSAEHFIYRGRQRTVLPWVRNVHKIKQNERNSQPIPSDIATQIPNCSLINSIRIKNKPNIFVHVLLFYFIIILTCGIQKRVASLTTRICSSLMFI